MNFRLDALIKQITMRFSVLYSKQRQAASTKFIYDCTFFICSFRQAVRRINEHKPAKLGSEKNEISSTPLKHIFLIRSMP